MLIKVSKHGLCFEEWRWFVTGFEDLQYIAYILFWFVFYYILI